MQLYVGHYLTYSATSTILAAVALPLQWCRGPTAPIAAPVPHPLLAFSPPAHLPAISQLPAPPPALLPGWITAAERCATGPVTRQAPPRSRPVDPATLFFLDFSRILRVDLARVDFALLLRDHARNGSHDITLVERDQSHTLRVTPSDTHLIHRRPDHN